MHIYKYIYICICIYIYIYVVSQSRTIKGSTTPCDATRYFSPATHCDTLQHTATHFLLRRDILCYASCSLLAAHCNTLQRTATLCNMLHHATTRCNMPQHMCYRACVCVTLRLVHCRLTHVSPMIVTVYTRFHQMSLLLLWFSLL